MFTNLVESNRQLQARYESTEQLCKEYHDRNQALLWDLARLKSESAAMRNRQQPAGSWVIEPPRDLPAASGSWCVPTLAKGPP